MGSLFDELKKSKLIDKKRARQLAHEQRVERTAAGGDVARDEELSRKRGDYEERKSAERRHHREREKERAAAQKERERRAELKQLVASRALGEEASGPRRWHFRSQGGSLPYLPVNEATSRRLQAGEYAIVRDPSAAWPRYVIVPRDVAIQLQRIDGAAVCYLAGS